MVATYSLPLAASAKRLSDVFGGSPGVVDPVLNTAFRQLLFTATGGTATLGSAGVTTTTGIAIPTTAPMPVSLGPFNSGALKLSDLYAVGAGSTLTILGVPF